MDDTNLLVYLFSSHIFMATIFAVWIMSRRHYLSISLPGWLLLVWLFPFWGIFIYILFVNRETLHCVGQPLTALETGKLNNNDFDFIEDEYFTQRLLEDIKQAKHSIFIMTYIFGGHISEKFLDSFQKAGDRGVSVVLVIDRIGSIKFLLKKRHPVFRSKNFTLKVYHKSILKSWYRVNRRVHSKVAVIDDKITYLGSHNIRDESTDTKSHTFANNVSIRIVNAVIALYYRSYVQDFPSNRRTTHKGKKELSGTEKVYVAETYAIKPKYDLYQSVIQHIISAKKSIYICTPYAVLPKTLRDIIAVKKQQGLDIKILIPKVPDSSIVQYNHKLILRELLDVNVSCYLSNPNPTSGLFDHSKFMIIDDQILGIGSLNFDYRSFFINAETVIYINEELVVKKLISIFERKLAAATPITKIQFTRFEMIISQFISIPASIV